MSVAVRRYGNVLDGGWRDDVGDGVITVLNPATGEPIAEVPNATAADVDVAVQAAERAYADWGDTTPGERATLLHALADALESAKDELGRLESENVGKPVGAAIEEVESSADCLRFFAGAARVLEGKATAEYVRNRTSMIRRDPIGVVAQITPWNYPLNMAAWKIGPALAAGNTVVLKPSELTPLTTLRLGEIAAGILPPGVLNVVTGDGVPTGEAMVRHPRVRMVSLTGDVATGKLVAATAADNLKRVHLELGGKAPVIVFDDADLDAVAATLKTASYWNAGQDCTAASRIMVADSIFDDFLGTFVPQVESIVVGDPAQIEDLDMGPVISSGQQERVLGFLDRATSGGARIATGGERAGDRGFFVQPTVVTDVGQGDEIVQREVFGPVVTVQRFDDEADALAWANDVEYGLSASVWSRDIGRCMRMARKLEFGAVWLNDHFTLTSEMPHGGYKQSGYGKDLSAYALEEYTIVKHVMVNLE
jgi:1-pyrroline dehydrogenase